MAGPPAHIYASTLRRRDRTWRRGRRSATRVLIARSGLALAGAGGAVLALAVGRLAG